MEAQAHNFAFIVLELFPEIVNQENNKKLLNLEDFYIKSLSLRLLIIIY